MVSGTREDSKEMHCHEMDRIKNLMTAESLNGIEEKYSLLPKYEDFVKDAPRGETESFSGGLNGLFHAFQDLAQPVLNDS
jgi:hypothetical protein